MENCIEKLVPSPNGIIIISNNNNSWCTKTFRDKENKIDTLTVPTVFFEALWDTEFEMFSPFNVKKVFLPLGIIIILLGLSLMNPYAFFFCFYFVIVVLNDLLYFTSLLYMYKRKKSPLYSTSMFHAAGHMVLNAYEKYQRVPTLEEVKKSSRYHKDGVYVYKISELLFKIVGCIVLTIFCRLSLAYFIGALLSLILFWIAFTKLDLLKYSEYFILSTPTDEQLEVVIYAFENLEASEEKMQRYDNALTNAMLNSFKQSMNSLFETMKADMPDANKSQEFENTDETST